MERDALLSHGVAFCLHDRLMNCSDSHLAFVCAQCGGLLSVYPQEYKEEGSYGLDNTSSSSSSSSSSSTSSSPAAGVGLSHRSLSASSTTGIRRYKSHIITMRLTNKPITCLLDVPALPQCFTLYFPIIIPYYYMH